MANYINVNPKVLEWTRESLRLDFAKASKLSGISIERIQQFESDENPNLEELKALSKAYKVSIATFLLYEPQAEKPLPKDRRTVNSALQGIFDPKTILSVRKARALLYSLIELKEELGLPITRFLHQASLEDDGSEVAKHFRKEWNLDEIREYQNINIALEAYIEKVESLGIAIFQLPLTKDDLRGFSIVDEQLPIIVIKRGNEPPTAKIFTLFHEVGHILLNEGGICDIKIHNEQQSIEKWCNAFAAEILVPSKELLNNPIVKRYLSTGQQEWTQNDLIEVGSYFHVGPLVILRRLLDHDRTTKEFYEEKHNVWNKPSFRRAKKTEGRNIPKEIIKERGKTYISLAFNAFEQNKINLKDLSDYLGAKLSYIPKIRQLLYKL